MSIVGRFETTIMKIFPRMTILKTYKYSRKNIKQRNQCKL